MSRVLWNVRMPMRDGVELAANVYLPDGDGPFPTIYATNPYGRQAWADNFRWRFLTENGYAVVHQDARGRFDSDGEFYPFWNDGRDGYDSVEWLAEQPWSTGKIGMLGGSYGGWTQWATAKERPPHLAALVSSCAAGKWQEELPWDRGGISLVMFTWLWMTYGRSGQDTKLVDWGRVFKHLPLRTMDRAMGVEFPAWDDWLDHPLLDDYWKQGRLDDDFAELDLPVLHLTGLFDGDQPGQMYFWDGMKQSRSPQNQHLLVGPWTHAGVFFPVQYLRDLDFRPRSVVDMDTEHVRWFDYWLKGIDNGVMAEPPVRYFSTGTNEWQTSDTWPLAGTTERVLHLRSGGGANTSLGDGRLSLDAPSAEEPEDVYRYDPAGVEEFADVNFFPGAPNEAGVPVDARPLERREDILYYTSEPLTEPLVVTGRPTVVLHTSSDCPDTDWVVGLSDVDPSGRAVPLSRDEDHQHLPTQGGRVRARFREGLDREVFMTPGEVYEVEIPLRDTAHVFKAGHRIRLAVLSWDFPSVARNLNTDESIADGTTIRVATNRVHHSPATPSRVILPVAPG